MTPEQQDALADLSGTARYYQRTDQAHKNARAAAVAAVIRALLAGVAPAEVERRSPFTGSYIRRLARDAGIPPDERYVRR